MDKNMDNQEETVAEEQVSDAAAEESAAPAEAVEAPAKTTGPLAKNTMYAIEQEILAEQNNDGKFPEFNVGDTIKVYVKISEGNKERLQPYEGVVMGFKHGANRKSFIVRRISFEVAVERVFPFHSPYIEKIDLVRRGRVRRAKLYYLRGRFGKAAKIREKVNAHK